MRRLIAGIVACVVVLSTTAAALADDSTIAQQLSSDLRAAKQSKELQAFRINVKVENGIVWMKGAVNDAEQKAKALDIARRVSGVRLVVNDLASGDATMAGESTSPPDSGNNASTVAPTSATMAASSSAFASMPGAQAIDNGMAMSRSTVPNPATMMVGSSPIGTAMSAPAMDDGVMQAAAQLQAVKMQTAKLQMEAAQLQLAHNRMLQTQIASQRAAMAKQAGANRLVNYCADGGCGVGGGCGSGNCFGGSGSGSAYDSYGGGYGGGGYGGGYGGTYGGTDIGYGGGVTHESAQMPGYAWPSYAASPNYAALSYPKQYSAQAWPYIGPFYPYPQVPLGWRKVSLEWDDGWWMLDFSSK